MKTGAFLWAAALAVAPLAKSEQCRMADRANHDLLQPFPEPKPTTVSEIAAIRFKPTLYIEHGCHPYPAVNAQGNTSSGLKPTGPSDGRCKKPPLGSQIYARADWYDDQWGIIFAWFFPKDSVISGIGHRYDWEWIVVWINNPNVSVPILKGVTTVESEGLVRTDRIEADQLSPNGPKFEYDIEDNRHYIELSEEDGESQPLIMWHQMTPEAQCALNNAKWNKDRLMPLADDVFKFNLANAYNADPDSSI